MARGLEPDGPPLLTVREVTAGYGDVTVLRGLSLDIRAGEFLALVGPNGSGKSTLLRAIAGLLPIRSGEILLGDHRIDGCPAYEIAARGLTLIPEDRRLWGPLSVRENLELGAFLPHARERKDETLRTIWTVFPALLANQRALARMLSGGEQQMLALARGLMTRPRLLCLDDPFLGLARGVTDRFCEALHAVAADGITVLAAGQHVRRLLRLATRACLLEAGQVVVTGSGADLLGDERVRNTLLEIGRRGRAPAAESRP
jgi:branched-chain amino acid transport system ATP-binding protein